ncbi:MAG: hypothetical protein ACK42E_04065 [Candidatus Bipolaricaulaceae bacterium]
MAGQTGAPFLGRLPLFPEVVAREDARKPLEFSDPARQAFLTSAERVWEFLEEE